MIAREVGIFPLKDEGGNRPNYIKSTWKPSFGKVYTVSNNCRLASGSYTVLVSVGDLVRLVFTPKSFLKGSRRNSMGMRVGLGAAIQATYSPGSKSSLHTVFCTWRLRPTRHRYRLVVYFVELRYKKVDCLLLKRQYTSLGNKLAIRSKRSTSAIIT